MIIQIKQPSLGDNVPGLICSKKQTSLEQNQAILLAISQREDRFQLDSPHQQINNNNNTKKTSRRESIGGKSERCEL